MRIIRSFLFLIPILALGLIYAPLVAAETTADAKAELSDTMLALKASSKRHQLLQQKTMNLERELASLQKDMVSAANETKEREDELSTYEEKMQILQDQRQAKQRALEARQAEISSMISAMVKLGQLPPQAVIAMPGKLEETLDSARALGVVTDTIESEAESLKEQLKELTELQAKIEKNRLKLEEKSASLEAKQKELQDKIKKRARLQEALGGEQRAEKERMTQLAAKSKNLQELLESIDKNQRRSIAERNAVAGAAKKTNAPSKRELRSITAAKGRLRLPANGKIVSHFGNENAGAAFSKGLIIDTREGAGVVAPFDGEVVYAGPFRDYGTMVILRHSNDYHTLLSGFDRVDARVGQFLLEGEPIGAMAKRAGGTRLYLELREDQKPVNPLSWFRR